MQGRPLGGATVLLVACALACGGKTRESGRTTGAPDDPNGSGGDGTVVVEGDAGRAEHVEGPVESEPLDAPARISKEELRDGLIEVMCPRLASCCVEAGYAATSSACAATLEANIAESLTADPSLYSFDQAQAARCLEGLRSWAGTAPCDPLWRPEDGSCGSAFAGTLPVGAPCASVLECADPDSERDRVHCADSEGGERRCVLQVRGQEGDPCEWSCRRDYGSLTCSGSDVGTSVVQGRCFAEDGLRCDVLSRCAPLSGLGGLCASSGDCLPELRCLDGACRPRALEGDACAGDEDCASGLRCVGGVCEVGLPMTFGVEVVCSVAR